LANNKSGRVSFRPFLSPVGAFNDAHHFVGKVGRSEVVNVQATNRREFNQVHTDHLPLSRDGSQQIQ